MTFREFMVKEYGLMYSKTLHTNTITELMAAFKAGYTKALDDVDCIDPVDSENINIGKLEKR